MKKLVRILSCAVLVAATSGLSQPLASTANTITLVALNQPPCAVPSPESVIVAKLAYSLADTEQSEHGYAVSIKFQGTDPRMTYSMGRMGEASVTSPTDTLTLQYPMASILRDGRLRRPITCYFYLHRNTGEGRSTVIAKTPPVIFRECQ